MVINRSYRQLMNQTEAWETVLAAARLLNRRTNRVCIEQEQRDLGRALKQVTPKVLNMRRRLNATRELAKTRKRTAASMPPWLERATR